VPRAKHPAKKIKKNCFASAFLQHSDKENTKKKRKQALPSARFRHSANHLKKIKKTHFFAECRRVALGKGAVTATFLCRVPSWHSGNPLPSARHAALGKEAFAMKGYADSSLPSAALDKDFAECKAFFAKCNCTRQSTRLL